MNDNYPTVAWFVYSLRYDTYTACNNEDEASDVLYDLFGHGEVIKFDLGMPQIVPVAF